MSYVEDRVGAAAAIAEDGMVMTLTYPGGGTYNPATGSTSGSPPDPETLNGLILPLAGYRKVDGAVIVAGDEALFLSALNTDGDPIVEPQVNGTVTAGSSVYTLTVVDPLHPGGLDIFYDCVGRRNA